MKSILAGIVLGFVVTGTYFGYEYSKIRREVIRVHGIARWKEWR